MNTPPAKEIKRRDQKQRTQPNSSKRDRDSLWDFLMNRPWPAGTRTQEEMDAQIAEERASWGDR